MNIDSNLSIFLSKMSIKNVEGDILNAKVKSVDLKVKEKYLKLMLSSKNVLSYKGLKKLREEMKNALPGFEKIDVEVEYTFLENLEISEVIERAFENIKEIIREYVPSSKAWLKNVEYEVNGNIFVLKVENEFFAHIMKKKSIDDKIKQMLKKEYQLNVNVQIDYSTELKALIKEHEEIRNRKEMNAVTAISMNALSASEEAQEKKAEKKEDKVNKDLYSFKKKSYKKLEDMIYGRFVDEEVVEIDEIGTESGNVTIEAEIFNIEIKDIKNGEKKLFMMDVTDYTNSITVKMFVNEKQMEEVHEHIKKGAYMRFKGDIVYDNFARCLVMMAKGIQKRTKKAGRMDLSVDKRVELHVHSKMSEMDGMAGIGEIIERAAKWGHKAIAITDHGIVQAFPDAMSAAAKHNVKVLYGVEGYLINDDNKVVTNPREQELYCDYVVFDIETTGFSPIDDGITEIGAVRYSGGKIVDSFSRLVNPKKAIPKRVVELTGITDEMVADKPDIKEVLPEFLEFVGDSVLVAHNAKFDMSFIKEKASNMGLIVENTVLDTLELSRSLLTSLGTHKLNRLAKFFGVSLENHHRAVDDSKATVEIFVKLLEMLEEKGAKTLKEVNKLFEGNINYKNGRPNHIVIFAKDMVGLRNLYELISKSHINFFHRNPRIPKSVLQSHREGLIIGSACEAGELFRAILDNKSLIEIEEIVNFYDYLEIQPIGNNEFLLRNGKVESKEKLRDLNRRIYELGKRYNKPVVATGDVHFLDPKDEAYRRILMAGKGFQDADNQPPLYFKTTNEMLEEFSYLGEKEAYEVVVENTNMISDMVEEILPIPKGTFPPIIDGSDEELREMTNAKARRIYGEPLPDIVKDRLNRELDSIISNGYAVLYIISQKLVTKSLRDGYLVGSRGSVGSSFAATMSDITEVNPLPPHYICPNCKNSEFILDGSVGAGVDMDDKNCPKCGTLFIKEGHDTPFEVFLGFEGDKEPDIDLNFAGEYQSVAHKYVEELFGEGFVFRAGTIGTIAEKTAYGFVKKYFDERELPLNNAEATRLLKGCTGVKRTTGQHPGGVMVVPRNKNVHDFSPIQYPANDSKSGVVTLHFDYHSISGRILKLDILGHDTPTIIKMLEDFTGVNAQEISLTDPDTMKLFTSTESLGITPEDINSETGTFGIPEFGTKFVRQMLVDTQPTTFSELVRISGLSHGTDVWLNNAQELVRDGTTVLSEVISTRDDIMVYLIYQGLEKKRAFTIMEKVRKGKGLSQEDEDYMREMKVPEWYIWSCKQIKYMFPKAHAVAYVMMSVRIAYFKVHHPEAFYATYFTTKATDFDAHLIAQGMNAIKEKIKELEDLGNDKTAKDKNLLTVLEVASELYARNYNVCSVDLYKSDSDKFKIVEEGILPPLKALQGVGENAARNIVEARKDGEFISMEDLMARAKVNKTAIETLKEHGCLKGMPESNQLSLFNI